jgi:hypothetical protein
MHAAGFATCMQLLFNLVPDSLAVKKKKQQQAVESDWEFKK